MTRRCPRFEVSLALILILTGHGFHAARAGELCATVSYNRLGIDFLANNPGEDPVERLLRLRFDRDKHIAKLWGEFCVDRHGASDQAAVDDCVNASGYVRPIKMWQENQVASQSAENGGLELVLDQRTDFWGELAKSKCKGEPDDAKRRRCEINVIEGDTLIPVGNLRSQTLLSEGLQDLEIQHVMRLPFAQDEGLIETRVVLQGAEKTDTAVLDGHFSVVKCPDESREDRDLNRRMSKEIKRLTSK